MPAPQVSLQEWDADEKLKFDIGTEQKKYPEILDLMADLQNARASKSVTRKHLIRDNVLYYLTSPDDEPLERLYLPSHLKAEVITNYHDKNGHIGLQRLYNTIKRKYYWPNMYKELYSYVATCITCQERNLTAHKTPLQETDIAAYPFAKVALEICGPFPTTASDNRYIVSFLDTLSSCRLGILPEILP